MDSPTFPFGYGLRVPASGRLGGEHELRAVIVTKAGRHAMLRFPFRVTRCDLAFGFLDAFRIPSGATVRVQGWGGDAGLSRFVLRRPSAVRPSLSRIPSGTRLGTLRILRSTGRGTDISLTRPKTVREPAVLYRAGRIELAFHRSGPDGKLLEARGLPDDAIGATVTFTDAGIRAIGVPSRCRTLRFRVTIFGRTGIARAARDPILGAARQSRARLCRR